MNDQLPQDPPQPHLEPLPPDDPRVVRYLRNLPDPKDLPEPYYYPRIEDFSPSPPKPQPPLMRVPGMRWLRPALFFFTLFFVASFREWWWPASDRLSVSAAAVYDKHEYWRLFTALFTHSSLEHLLANTPLFLIFGWFLRAFFGWLAFPVATLLIGVLSNLATIWTYSPQTELLGASGMLYGMVALWLVFYVRFATEFAVPMRIFRAIGVSLLLLFPTTFEQNVSYMAHATGFLFGGVIGFILLPFVKVQADVEDSSAAPSHNGGMTRPLPGSDLAPKVVELHPPSRIRIPPV